MITVNIHDEFQFQIPDYFETHYKKEDEELSQDFIARYHPEDPEWEHFGAAEQSIGVSKYSWSLAESGVNYADSAIQENELSWIRRLKQFSFIGGLLKGTIPDPADDCPYIYRAEKQYMIMILERANDFSEVHVYLKINDGTSYEMMIKHSQDSEENKAFLESVLDSFSII